MNAPAALLSAGPAQIEGSLIVGSSGEIIRQGALFEQPPMIQAMEMGSLEPLRPLQGLSVNGVLRDDEWEAVDQAVIAAYLDELVAFRDLDARGLTFALPNAMAFTLLQWEDIGQLGPANRSIYAATPAEDDLANYTLRNLPLPIVSKTFHLDQRILMTGRKTGVPIDTANVQRATRSVSESIDDMFFNGGFTYGAATVQGYLTHPQRNTITNGTANSDWSNAGATGTEIVADVIGMVDAAFQDNIPGPFVLYIPYSYNAKLDEDFKADSDKTIRQRILEISGVQAIVPTRRLTTLNVVLTTMRNDVVDAVVGFRPTPIQWETQGGAVTNFKVMSIIVPRIKQDSDNRSGIVHLTLTV